MEHLDTKPILGKHSKRRWSILSTDLSMLAITSVFLTLFLAGCTATNFEETTIEYSLIDEEHLPIIKKEALAGSATQAAKLYKHYSTIGNYEESLYWGSLAAEYGHTVSQYNIAIDLLDKLNAENRKKAIYWLKKASASGDKEAKDLLNKLKEENQDKFPLSR